MGTFPSRSSSERALQKITAAAVRAQDQFLSTVDAVVASPDLPTPRPYMKEAAN
jgi:UDP-N-acetylmuramoylalanine-D-glutamate ligase